MHVPEWLVTPFDVNIDNKVYEPDIQEKKSNINTDAKHHKLRAAAESFLLVFPTSYMVEAGLSHVKEILTKQRNCRAVVIYVL